MKIAVLGSGLTALSTAYFLIVRGYKCIVFEKNETTGGWLRRIDKKLLPQGVVDEEINFIESLGCEIRTKKEIDHKDIKKLKELNKDFDAVVIATEDNGNIPEDFNQHKWIFVCGNTVSDNLDTVKAVGEGRRIAEKIDEFLIPDKKHNSRINSRFGPLQEGDMNQFMKTASGNDMIQPENSKNGFSGDEAVKAAERCLHCDCGKPNNCKLRDLSSEFNADQKHYQEIKKDNKRAKRFIRNIDGNIIYEPGKCIKCGICVRICAEFAEGHGMTFTGRGYNTEVQIPFGAALSKGLGKAADKCVDQCPTGALVKDKVRG